MQSRRQVLAGLGALAATGIAGCERALADKDFAVPGRILGAAAARGHLLRVPPSARAPGITLRCETVIVGAGISGLSAAAALDAAQRGDYLVCELADEAGGNAVGGHNGVSSYPWGAHYVPIADPADEALCRFFHQVGVIRGFRADGVPLYEEELLCADPDERLWIQGLWQDGFVPTVGVGREDTAQARRFFDAMNRWRLRLGNDGRFAFALPLAHSSSDPAIEALDAVSFPRLPRARGLHERAAALVHRLLLPR